MLEKNLYGNLEENEFYRPATRKERSGLAAMSKALSKMPDRDGWYKYYRPFDGLGRGFYYARPVS